MKCTTYPDPPEFAYHNTITASDYRFIWKNHNASITPQRVGHFTVFRVGIDLYQPERTVRTYLELQQAFYNRHRLSIALHGPFKLSSNQAAALLSLEVGIGSFGLCASEVVWVLHTDTLADISRAWMRYAWPDGKFSPEQWRRREAELKHFLL